MAQHYLLSSAAPTLSVTAVSRMSEDEGYLAFKAIRWAETDGEPVCPKCGGLMFFNIASRRKFKCKDCLHTYSVTSGTIFASRKLPIRDILTAIAIFNNGAKGYSALQLSRDLDVQYKTAFVLAHKLREAVADLQPEELGDVVEIDGAYFGGHVKQANKKSDRVDRRKAEHATGKRQVVIVMRERNGTTRAFVAKSEKGGVREIIERVAPGTTIHADESSAWDNLTTFFPMKRINHQEAFSLNGACTNMAESFFSRLRRPRAASITGFPAATSARMQVRWLGARICGEHPTGASSYRLQRRLSVTG